MNEKDYKTTWGQKSTFWGLSYYVGNLFGIWLLQLADPHPEREISDIGLGTELIYQMNQQDKNAGKHELLHNSFNSDTNPHNHKMSRYN